MKAPMVMRRTLMPAAWAACRLPPTAYRWRPIVVVPRITAETTTTISIMMIGIGTPHGV